MLVWVPRNRRVWAQILGVDRDVSTRSLKKAYRRLSLKYHPDKQVNPTKAEAKAAQDKFMEISEAFGVLNDPEKRRVYDQWGEEGLDDQQSGGGGGGRDPFSMFHNFGFGQRRQARPQRGPDVRVRV